MRADQTRVGHNRTGIAVWPNDSPDIIQAARRACAVRTPDARALAVIRELYESKAEPVGTVPIPIKPGAPAALIDRMAQRLAFERSGTRHGVGTSDVHGANQLEMRQRRADHTQFPQRELTVQLQCAGAEIAA